MTILGLIMATVGEGALYNLPRFTMGIMDLQSGFGFITLAMAMFALPEALFLVLDPSRSKTKGTGRRSRSCASAAQRRNPSHPLLDANLFKAF